MKRTKNLAAKMAFSALILFFVFISGCLQPSPPVQGGINEAKPTQNTGAQQQPPVQAGSIFGLPIYPGSNQTAQYNMIVNATGISGQFSELKVFEVDNASVSDIINWYKSQLSDYELLNETTVNTGGVSTTTVLFKQGDNVVGVVAFKQGGKTVYIIGKTEMPEGGSYAEGEPLPEQDMASGEEPLTRYPGSIMLSYEKTGNFPVYYYIEYGTNDEYTAVGDWFKNTLQTQGWETKYQSGTSEMLEMTFGKGDDEIKIIVSAPGAGRDYTLIDISYTKRSLPEHDLVEGSDPIERYPNSVMVDYEESTTTLFEQTMHTTKAVYLAPDTLEKVKQWYKEKLKEKAFNMVHESGDRIEASTTPTSGNKYDMVNIDFEAHSGYVSVSIEYIKIG